MVFVTISGKNDKLLWFFQNFRGLRGKTVKQNSQFFYNFTRKGGNVTKPPSPAWAGKGGAIQNVSRNSPGVMTGMS